MLHSLLAPTRFDITGMRRIIKRLLKKYNYPPEGREMALETIMTQCEMWSENNI